MTAAAAGLLLAGSVWGSDDDFPFGPFRMYAGVNDPNGDVVSSYMQASSAWWQGDPGRRAGHRTAAGRARGRGRRVRQRPVVAAALAEAHAELHPDEPPYVAVQVVQLDQHLRHAALAEQTTKVVAQWRRS